MRKTPKIVVQLRHGNTSAINPAGRQERAIVENALTLATQDTAVVRGIMHRTAYGTQYFKYDAKKRIMFPSGFGPRVRHALVKRGYQVEVEDLWRHPQPDVFVPQWKNLDRLLGFKFRPLQKEALALTLKRLFGRLSLPPGSGKSAMFPLYPLLLPKARFHFVTDSATVCKTRIYPSLLQTTPDVGMRGAGRQDQPRRVMVYTLDSLQHSTFEAEFFIGDEIQDFGADCAAAQIGRYRFSRNFGFSASINCRSDGKDAVTEAVFGPVIYHVPYQAAVDNDLVVPVEVRWRTVYGRDPAAGEDRLVEQQRLRYWLNHGRNDAIADDAKKYGPSVQTLIVVDKVQHAIELKKRLPEYALAFRNDDPADHARREELEAVGEDGMDNERLMQRTRAFAARALKKAICTGVWGVGVDFPGLGVLLRGDGKGSKIADEQIPGRATRIDKETDKVYAVLHDYDDQFARGPQRKSQSRYESYVKNGWRQVGWGGAG